MRHFLVIAALLAACHGSDPSKGAPIAPSGSSGSGSAVVAPGSGSAAPAAGSDTAIAGAGSGSAAPTPPPTPAKPPEPPIGGHDFTPEAKALLVVGACAEGPIPAAFDATAKATVRPQAPKLGKGKMAKKPSPKEAPLGTLLEEHCKAVREAQADYLEQWVKPARAFFADHVPVDVPSTVVYPFAGGDLSTALTVFPNAAEITTLSLEPAGDPRDLSTLHGSDLEHALNKAQYELSFLYRVNFSNTINMIDAMREGSLPTELIFALSALKIHGYDVESLRYFRLETDGSIHYLDDDDLAKVPAPLKAKPGVRNRIFANMEIRFRKAGGPVQIYRHIQQNLDNEHLAKDARVLKHLEAKGTIAGMTKAASYLLSWDSFSTMRNYLIGHVAWMVSDATGVAPKWGKPAGFAYETFGGFVLPHIPAGNGIAKDWRAEFEAEPHRDLAFRFGYYDKKNTNHLIVMSKGKSPK